jgi:2-keto-4-pentenoate hydratase
MTSLATAELARDPRVVAGLEAQLELRRHRLAAGERPLGWKLGFGASAARESLGTAAPLIGFLTDRSFLVRPESHSVEGWTAPVLEPEVAVRLGRTLVPGGPPEEAKGSIDGLAPAFELVEVDPPPTEVERILAGNVFHRGVVLGPFVDPSRAPLERLRAEVIAGEANEAVDDPQAATGPIVGLVRHVADLLGHFGLELAAGEVVICGSIVPPISVDGGARVRYRLAPIGELAIELTG